MSSTFNLMSVIFLLYYMSKGNADGNNSFVQLYDCTCAGCTQVYECTVVGGGITVWRGSALGCERDIHLRHSDYMNAQARHSCNNGTVVARSVGVLGISYTSILNITVQQGMVNGSVECAHIDNTSQLTEIGQGHVNVTQAPYAPPNDVHVAMVALEKDQIIFAWSEVSVQCPYIRYIISAVNCGLCPNSTVDTTVTCGNISDSVQSNKTCMFAIQTETCGSILGNTSEFAKNATMLYTVLTKSENDLVNTTPYSRSQINNTVLIFSIATVLVVCVMITAVVLLFLVMIRLIMKRKPVQYSNNDHETNSAVAEDSHAVLSDQNEQHEMASTEHEHNNGAIYSLLQVCQNEDDNPDKSEHEHQGVTYTEVVQVQQDYRPGISSDSNEIKVHYATIK